MKSDTFKLKNHLLLTRAVLSAMLVISAMGCAQKYGSLQQNAEAHQAFQKYVVLSDYVYYFQGLESQPFAIAGIHQRYELNARLWQQFDPAAPALENLMDRLIIRHGHEPLGFIILDHNREKLGIWYSSFHWATVQTGTDNHIIVLSPEAPSSGTQR
ncbi:MAG: hypothetical protein JRF72_22635 [Deltaproteobacteria bacterium]|jgi:hypothetical protein|nr:hypothetical protein [Deltaproteobacteria bacterium]